MPLSEAKKRSNKKWNVEKSVVLFLRVKPSEAEQIRETANNEKLTVTRYLVQCHVEHTKKTEPGA